MGTFGKLNLDENVVTELAVDTMVWSTMKTSGPTPPMRADHCMAANEDGSRVVVYGGRVNNLPNGEVFVLETATGVWTKGTPGDPRMYVACTITGNLLLIWGGTNAAIAIPTSDMLIYNYISGTWLTSYTPPALYQGLVPPIIPVTGPGSTRPQPSSPALSSTRSTPGSTIGGDHGSAAQPPNVPQVFTANKEGYVSARFQDDDPI
ncbi:hypothetical protein EC991_006920 [Linnemannia zychae]|nr:hypothetical protein EC991_006920 [Linnemannia zychae]